VAAVDDKALWIGLALALVLLYIAVAVEWQFKQLERRVKALEGERDRVRGTVVNLGDLRNPTPDAVRDALDPARRQRSPES
jgi:hypothetical protein